MKKLVYIVDDEVNILNLVSMCLRDEGFQTQEFTNGGAFLEALHTKLPDCVVLDWMMPPPDGREICLKIRSEEETKSLPIIILTARSGEFDKVLGLEIGADDYITKPFSLRELVARVRAVIRRSDIKSVIISEMTETFECKNLSLNVERRKVMKDGQNIELTMKEFDLLKTLMMNSGKVLTRDILLDNVWGMEYYGDTRTVDVHVRYLRQKIEDESDNPSFIQTIRGVGYRFNEQTTRVNAK